MAPPPDPPRRVLITRPRLDAEPLAEILRGHGIEAVIEPMLDIRVVDGPAFDLDGVQALAMTSANGVRAFAARHRRRDLPVYAVGGATAREAVRAGFTSVVTADGDVDSLAPLIAAELDPGRGAVFHAAGSARAGDLGGLLGHAGFAYRRGVCYEAVTAETLSPAVATALREQRIDAVVLYSPRTAKTFRACAEAAGCAAACRHLAAYCLSPAVARAAKGLAWRAVVIAARPEQGVLIKTLLGESD